MLPALASAVEPAVIARLAVGAIRAEALLTPKPGLVDRNGSGGHTDMDLAMLLRSADALSDTFSALALVGATESDPQRLRNRVGELGRTGEAAMLEATGGVNTHRGALWTLGLLVTAAAATTTESEILAAAARLARTPDSAGGPAPASHGQQAVRRFGVSGAVGEAAAGFPHIAHIALPELRMSRRRGDSDDRARLRSLLALVASVDDTCVLHRGGTAGLRWMQRTARQALRARRFESAAARFADRADERRLSAGGSADLLAGAIFLDSITRLGVASATNIHAQEVTHAHV